MKPLSSAFSLNFWVWTDEMICFFAGILALMFGKGKPEPALKTPWRKKNMIITKNEFENFLFKTEFWTRNVLKCVWWWKFELRTSSKTILLVCGHLLNISRYWTLDSKTKRLLLTKIIIYDYEWREMNFDGFWGVLTNRAGTSMRENKKTKPFRQSMACP